MDNFKHAKEIENTINDCSFKPKDSAYYMAFHCHRYLQDKFFKMALGFIQLCGENYRKGIYDGRNEYACKMSAKILDKLEKDKDFWPMDFSDVKR